MHKILVIGDGCDDVYIYGKCKRLCPDAPVPILLPFKKITNGGMAKNVYENIKSLGIFVDIITHRNTITKTRYVDEKTNQMFIRIDEGEDHGEKANLKKINFFNYDIVVISDYCKGFVDEDIIHQICNIHKNVFIDTKRLLGPYCEAAKIIKINEQEYENNINAKVNMTKFQDNLIVTLGNKGCKYKDKIYPVESVDIKDMTGAGDTFMACLAVNYMKTKKFDSAIKFANECATIIVQHKGVLKIGDFVK